MMGIWAEIKLALNSTLGKNLKTLDRIIAETEHSNYYHTVANNVLIHGDGDGSVLVIGEEYSAIPALSAKSTAIEIVVPNTVSESAQALKDSVSLTIFRIPPTWEKILSRMFEGCSNLAYLNIHDYITEIYGLAFSGCSKLRTINIGSGVKKIYAQAFNGTTILVAHYNGTQAQWEAIEKEDGWNGDGGLVSVVCKDGTITY